MTLARNMRVAAAATLASATVLLSVLSLVALNTGGAAPAMHIAMGYDRAAETLLDTPHPTPVARADAARLSHAALKQFPYDTSPWLRLAYIDWLQNGRLTPTGLAMLKRSYDLIAVDPDVGEWRIRFALENSQSLSKDLRAAVRNEVLALMTNGKTRGELKQIQPTIQNPAGRLSLALWLSRPTTVAK